MLDPTTFHQAARREGGISRRTLLAYGATLSALPWLADRSRAEARRRVSFASDPFTLGVASGDPTGTGVVLWTRLAPRPLEPGGGRDPAPVAGAGEGARDD